MPYDLLIIFVDGTRKVVEGVNDYGLMATKEVAYFIKGDYKGLMPIEQIVL